MSMDSPDSPAALFTMIGTAIAGIGALFLMIAVLTGNIGGIVAWGVAQIEGAFWLTVAGALGLTAIFGTLAGSVLKAFAE